MKPRPTVNLSIYLPISWNLWKNTELKYHVLYKWHTKVLSKTWGCLQLCQSLIWSRKQFLTSVKIDLKVVLSRDITISKALTCHITDEYQRLEQGARMNF